jgi:thymidylate kinase
MAALLGGTTTVVEAATWANGRLLDLGILPPASAADTLAHRRRARLRHARRARVATGIVAVTGPDGAGKGTVIAHLRSVLTCPSTEVRFKNLFRHHPLYKVLLARHRRRPGEEKNQWDERHARSLFSLARHAWPLLRLRAALGRVLWCDRYWHDLLFEGLRLREDAPRLTPAWRTYVARLPVPGWHLHLDAPDGVILARKDELPAAALPVYRAGMIDLMLAADEPLITVLHTGGSLEETLVAARRAALAAGLR